MSNNQHIEQSNLNTNPHTSRIDYVDILKGFAILAVIWSHTVHTYFGNWSPGMFGNIVFFFLSGFFFKIIDVKTFIAKKGIKILLPFLVFYALSYPFDSGSNIGTIEIYMLLIMI